MDWTTSKLQRWRLFGGVLLLAVSGCGRPEAPANPTSGHTNDADVTFQVNAALRQDETLQPFTIAVVTAKGDVRLSGEVETESQHALAVKIARDTEGAHSIHDELTVKQ